MSITKDFRYRVGVNWEDGRITTVTSPDKPDLTVATPPEFKNGVPGVWSPEDLLVASVASCYAVTLVAALILGSAALKYREKASEQQEVLAAASDMIMDVLTMESAILRTEKLAATKGAENCALQIDAARVFASDAIQRVERSAKTALAAMVEGDELRMMMGVLRRYMKYTPINTVAARRRIADSIVEAGRYNL